MKIEKFAPYLSKIEQFLWMHGKNEDPHCSAKQETKLLSAASIFYEMIPIVQQRKESK